MKPTKKISILFAAAAIAAGCSQEEPAGQSAARAIELDAQTDAVASRANTALPKDYTLWVNAIYHSQDGKGHAYFFAESQEQEFVTPTGGVVWVHNGDPLYYPASGSIDFLAYAVQNASHKPEATYGPSILSSEHQTFSSLTLNFGDKLDATDPVVFSDIKNAPCGQQASCQQLQMRNALSKIVFKAFSETASAFTIYSLSVLQVHTSGLLEIVADFTTEATVGDNTVLVGSQAEWTALYGSKKDVALAGIPAAGMHPKNSASEGIQIGNTGFYLPTQETENISIKIEYAITNGSTTTPHYFKTVQLPAGKWLPETQYTYILNCTLTEIYVAQTETGAILHEDVEDVVSDEVYP